MANWTPQFAWLVASSAALSILVLGALLFVRETDLPEPIPVSPFQHLDERKAAIYENLRDLQFEYRVGKLSDADYQQTKLDLQRELAGVLAEVDRIKGGLPVNTPVLPPIKGAKALPATLCANCGAEFAEVLKFCGECGAPIHAARGEA